MACTHVRRMSFVAGLWAFGMKHVCPISSVELELELIQSHMTQKPMLRGEVGARVRVACVPHMQRGATAEAREAGRGCCAALLRRNTLGEARRWIAGRTYRGTAGGIERGGENVAHVAR